MKSHCVAQRMAFVASASGLAMVLGNAGAQVAAPQTLVPVLVPVATEGWPEPDHGTESIEALRWAAAAGDADAALAVATRLVDRFERGGMDRDLFEATIWIDRYHGNEAFAASGLIARVQQNDCRHKVLRLHWICEAGE